MKRRITFIMLHSIFMVFSWLSMIWFKDLPKLISFYLGDGSFVGSPTFIPSNLSSLQSIEIGNECYMKTRKFTIDGLNALQSLFIGEYSFTKYKDMWDSDWSRAFTLKNCAALETIEIRYMSFADYAGPFEFKNLPALRSIRLGSPSLQSTNFNYQSFILRGIHRSSPLVNRFSQPGRALDGFKSFWWVSSYGYRKYSLLFLYKLDLPKLKKIELRTQAIAGVRDRYDCTLVMRSFLCVVGWMRLDLESLETLSASAFSLLYQYNVTMESTLDRSEWNRRHSKLLQCVGDRQLVLGSRN